MGVVSCALPLLLVSSFFIVQVFADHKGCHSNEDCGPNIPCNANGACDCPQKSFVFVPEAKPMCQSTKRLGDSCHYSQQCESENRLSRCNKGQCECYDTEKDGRDHVFDYKESCYRATALGGKCYTQEQCKASITPPDYAECKPEHDQANQGTCRCLEGKKCEERSGQSSGMYAGAAVVTLTLFMLTAVKIVL